MCQVNILTVTTTFNPVTCFLLLLEDANTVLLQERCGGSVLHSQNLLGVRVLSFLPVLGSTPTVTVIHLVILNTCSSSLPIKTTCPSRLTTDIWTHHSKGEPDNITLALHLFRIHPHAVLILKCFCFLEQLYWGRYSSTFKNTLNLPKTKPPIYTSEPWFWVSRITWPLAPCLLYNTPGPSPPDGVSKVSFHLCCILSLTCIFSPNGNSPCIPCSAQFLLKLFPPLSAPHYYPPIHPQRQCVTSAWMALHFNHSFGALLRSPGLLKKTVFYTVSSSPTYSML